MLDPQNRAHELDNLYVVDTSFFPSSAGLNPSLTVAANALRVAAHVNQVHFRQLTRSIASARVSTRHAACCPKYQLGERISVQAGIRTERPAAR